MIQVPSQFDTWGTERKRAFLEMELLSAHARYKTAELLGLDCVEHCRAMYQSLREAYDNLPSLPS